MEVGEDYCLEGGIFWMQDIWGVFEDCGYRLYGVEDIYRQSVFSKGDV